MPNGSSFAALVFHFGDQLLLSPSDLSGQISEGTELTEVAQLRALHGIGHARPLLSIIGSGDSFEDFETAESSGSPGSFVRHHSSDGPPEDTCRGAVMDEGSARVSEETLPQEFGETDFVAEEFTADVERLGSDDYDLLA